jgi:chromosome segregation ATPase
LEKALASLEKHRERSKGLLQDVVRNDTESTNLRHRLVNLENEFQRTEAQLNRAQEAETELREEIKARKTSEEAHTGRIRVLERHSADLQSKHAQVSEANLGLVKEVAHLRQALEHKNTEMEEGWARYQAKLRTLEGELKTKTASAFELESVLRGVQYKHERELLKMERDAVSVLRFIIWRAI